MDNSESLEEAKVTSGYITIFDANFVIMDSDRVFRALAKLKSDGRPRFSILTGDIREKCADTLQLLFKLGFCTERTELGLDIYDLDVLADDVDPILQALAPHLIPKVEGETPTLKLGFSDWKFCCYEFNNDKMETSSGKLLWPGSLSA